MRKDVNDLDSCPHCGSDLGYYRYTKVSGTTSTNFGFQGEEVDNSHLHDSLRYTTQKTCYCIECHERVGMAND